MVSRRRSPFLLAATALVAVAVGCGSSEPDLSNGKRLFTGDVPKGYKADHAKYQPCSACHALGRANSTANAGPSLDQAFQQARKDGMTSGTVEGVVYGQIKHP